MKRFTLLAAAVVALTAAGGASAYALHTITLSPGHCKKVHGTKVCAKKVKPKTVTVSPSAVGKTFSGNGSETLPPFTVPKHGASVKWTSKVYDDGSGFTANLFSVSCGSTDFDNGHGATSGSSFLPAGTYTCGVIADDGGWTLSF